MAENFILNTSKIIRTITNFFIRNYMAFREILTLISKNPSKLLYKAGIIKIFYQVVSYKYTLNLIRMVLFVIQTQHSYIFPRCALNILSIFLVAIFVFYGNMNKQNRGASNFSLKGQVEIKSWNVDFNASMMMKEILISIQN